MISSKHQTKHWRNQQDWYVNGKKRECELFQIRSLSRIIDVPLQLATNIRINLERNTLESNRTPMTEPDGFEYTEDFDAVYYFYNWRYLVNFKMICDRGGTQTRSLREVYHFIKAQQRCSHKYLSTIFINILEGDECFRNRSKFEYLDTRSNIFIGDMAEFQDFWTTTIQRYDILEQMKSFFSTPRDN